MTDTVRIVEVGPRDGLQNEKTLVPAAAKIELIDRLSATGLSSIEATSFVSPKWVPQLADAAEVYVGIAKRPGVRYPVLVPNEQGYERARAVGVDEIAVFTAASEAFNQRNINATIAESLARFAPVIERARADGVAVRGYVSTVLGCPYQGEVPLADVVRVARALHAMGCYEISLGDTIGIGTPGKAAAMLRAVALYRLRCSEAMYTPALPPGCSRLLISPASRSVALRSVEVKNPSGSASSPTISAQVMPAKVAWKAAKTTSGM